MSSPESPDNDIPLAKNLRARVLYEATLQELLDARNYVVTQSKLTGKEINYSPMNFLHPPPPLLPYLATGSGHILQRRTSCPLLARFPKDRCRFDMGTQTVESDALASDMTLVDIGLATETQNKDQTSNKRPRTELGAEQDSVERGSKCKL
ncbi:hypothetical protein EDB83DRAFT_2314415 [Lactarius deliciosus]|nr:hypothetical protein EDB83DRAFT_2314415 [Lactarius deliciosus]